MTPYYSKPTQAGVTAHFEAVAAASGLPVMLYDIPGRTGITIADETYRARSPRNDRIVAVKDAVGDLFRGVRIMQETGLSFYSGDDVLNLGWLTHGALRDRLRRRPRRRRAVRLDGRRRRPAATSRPPSQTYRDARAGRRGDHDHRARAR